MYFRFYSIFCTKVLKEKKTLKYMEKLNIKHVQDATRANILMNLLNLKNYVIVALKMKKNTADVKRKELKR